MQMRHAVHIMRWCHQVASSTEVCVVCNTVGWVGGGGRTVKYQHSSIHILSPCSGTK